MGRPKKEDVKLKADVDKLRAKVIENFFELSDGMLLHIKDSLRAFKLCTNCRVEKSAEGKTVVVPGKVVDEQGLCGFCHGSNKVSDNAQRNWAVEMAQPIVAPAPKTVEAKEEKPSDLPEQAANASNLSDADLDELRAKLDSALKKGEVGAEDAERKQS